MELEKEELNKLITLAFDAQKNAHAPYSKFRVGACVLTKTGKFFCGANIENASYPAGICAERVAYSKAISEGEKEFLAVCITCDHTDTFAYPCGVCRQFMSEFGTETTVVVAKNLDDFKTFKLSELLPHTFDKNAL
ncbi:MAG: cytidine deaminase [Clostridia bacterium]|nr:cytidine deaminase [Clostridia bacterium]